MIGDTQKYLRKIMESNNNSVRFVLSAGSLDSIIEIFKVVVSYTN